MLPGKCFKLLVCTYLQLLWFIVWEEIQSHFTMHIFKKNTKIHNRWPSQCTICPPPPRLVTPTERSIAPHKSHPPRPSRPPPLGCTEWGRHFLGVQRGKRKHKYPLINRVVFVCTPPNLFFTFFCHILTWKRFDNKVAFLRTGGKA